MQHRSPDARQSPVLGTPLGAPAAARPISRLPNVTTRYRVIIRAGHAAKASTRTRAPSCSALVATSGGEVRPVRIGETVVAFRKLSDLRRRNRSSSVVSPHRSFTKTRSVGDVTATEGLDSWPEPSHRLPMGCRRRLASAQLGRSRHRGSLNTQHMLQLEPSRCPPRLLDRSSASEIRFVGLRNRMEILIEVIVHVLRANHLPHRHLVLAPRLFK
jgi:hypothetical protein